MSFTSKRGRPAAKDLKLTVIEGGKADVEELKKPLVKINREPIDICHKKGLIDDDEHWAAIHFRWLYNIKFGAPGISAIDYCQKLDVSARMEDPEWQESREREYAMAVEYLRKSGSLKIVMNLAVFGHFPKFLATGRRKGKYYSCHSAELEKLREGLDLLAKHWGKKGARLH